MLSHTTANGFLRQVFLLTLSGAETWVPSSAFRGKLPKVNVQEFAFPLGYSNYSKDIKVEEPGGA